MMKQKQRGLSLIELMVAMAVGLVFTLGITQVFISNKQGFTLVNDASVMMENGRVATDFVARSVRHAGYWAGAGRDGAPGVFGTATLSSNSTSCTDLWIMTPQTIQGFEGGSGGPSGFPADCLTTTQVVPNSDVLVVRYADATNMVADGQLEDGVQYVRLVPGYVAEIFTGNNIPALPEDANIGFNAEFRTEVYFLRTCSLKGTGGCIDEVPTLSRLTLQGGAFLEQPVVEGVEQLQFEYGISADGDGRWVDFYAPASEVTDWADVTSVRISVVARSLNKDLSLNNSEVGKKMEMAGGFEHEVGEADKHYRRKLFEREIIIRNQTKNIVKQGV